MVLDFAGMSSIFPLTDATGEGMGGDRVERVIVRDSETGAIVEGELGHCQFNAATGTMSDPDNINDDETGNTAAANTVGEYAQILFPTITRLARWRISLGGTNGANGDGEFKLQYFDIFLGEWTDWVTGIPYAPTGWDDWTDYVQADDIITSGVRIVCTVVDTGSNGESKVAELEVIY
jgi:hypothetical protein